MRLRRMNVRSSTVMRGSSSGRLAPLSTYATTQTKLKVPNTTNMRCQPLAAIIAGDMISAEMVPRSEPLATSVTRRLLSCTGYHALAIWCMQGNKMPSPTPIPALVKNRHVRHFATTTVDKSCIKHASNVRLARYFTSDVQRTSISTYEQRPDDNTSEQHDLRAKSSSKIPSKDLQA